MDISVSIYIAVGQFYIYIFTSLDRLKKVS